MSIGWSVTTFLELPVSLQKRLLSKFGKEPAYLKVSKILPSLLDSFGSLLENSKFRDFLYSKFDVENFRKKDLIFFKRFSSRKKELELIIQEINTYYERLPQTSGIQGC